LGRLHRGRQRRTRGSDGDSGRARRTGHGHQPGRAPGGRTRELLHVDAHRTRTRTWHRTRGNRDARDHAARMARLARRPPSGLEQPRDPHPKQRRGVTGARTRARGGAALPRLPRHRRQRPHDGRARHRARPL